MAQTKSQPVEILGVEKRLKAFALGDGTSEDGCSRLSPASASLLSTSGCDNQEAAMRKAFADTLSQELAYLREHSVEVSRERSRQILADVLVWAEITQTHYDPGTRRFVLEPNKEDEAFHRVGKFFQEAKRRHGV